MTNDNLLDGYYTREDLAQTIHRSVRTLDRWESLRIGPPRIVVGRLILYRKDSVLDWLTSREQKCGRRR